LTQDRGNQSEQQGASKSVQSTKDTNGLERLGVLTYRTTRRIVVALVGATLLAIGVVLVFTPGPAIVVLSLGLAVLAIEFAWARRWLRRLKETAGDAVNRVRAEREEAD